MRIIFFLLHQRFASNKKKGARNTFLRVSFKIRFHFLLQLSRPPTVSMYKIPLSALEKAPQFSSGVNTTTTTTAPAKNRPPAKASKIENYNRVKKYDYTLRLIFTICILESSQMMKASVLCVVLVAAAVSGRK